MARRAVRAVTAAVIVIALISQFAFGSDFESFSAMNFFSYFTVLSNIGAAAFFGVLALRPDLEDDPRLVVVRIGVTLNMAITGIVYNLLLAPVAADVSTNLEWVNSVVHVVGPLIVVGDYLTDPPRARPTVPVTAWVLAFPAVWMVYTMIRGPIVEWYPYPFLDPDLESVASIVVVCFGIFVALVAVTALLRWFAGRGAAAVPPPAAR